MLPVSCFPLQSQHTLPHLDGVCCVTISYNLLSSFLCVFFFSLASKRFPLHGQGSQWERIAVIKNINTEYLLNPPPRIIFTYAYYLHTHIIYKKATFTCIINTRVLFTLFFFFGFFFFLGGVRGHSP